MHDDDAQVGCHAQAGSGGWRQPGGVLDCACSVRGTSRGLGVARAMQGIACHMGERGRALTMRVVRNMGYVKSRRRTGRAMVALGLLILVVSLAMLFTAPSLVVFGMVLTIVG